MPERGLTPGRYAIDGSGRLYACRGRWRRNAVAIVTIKPRRDQISEDESKAIRAIEDMLTPPQLAESSSNAKPPAKISLKGAVSAMEQLAESWKRRG